MAKKNTTLNDLTRFLEKEQSTTVGISTKKEDFFEADPLSFIAVDADGVIATSKAEEGVTEKFIDSKAMQKTSFEDVHEQIKTLALENKMTVQQVITTLYMRTITPVSITNMFDWTVNMQKNYTQFWMDLQKNWKL
jgi:hypothetical protein